MDIQALEDFDCKEIPRVIRERTPFLAHFQSTACMEEVRKSLLESFARLTTRSRA